MNGSPSRRRGRITLVVVSAALAIAAGIGFVLIPRGTSSGSPELAIPRLSPATGTASTVPAASLPAGEVTRIYLPSRTAKMVINAPVQPIVQEDRSIADGDCSTIIQPTVSGSGKTGVFQCTNYPSPSTRPAGTVVLAGHQSVDHYWNTVFDRLSCTPSGCGPFRQSTGCAVQRGALTGRDVFLQTRTSGRYWYSYKVTKVYCPSKTADADLAEKQTIWKPTPGRLLLVTCLEQQGLRAGASNNLIVQADYRGLSADAAS